MALVLYGGGILGMSGSIGGQTHARNRYGPYVRARTVPVNPNTALQQRARSAVAALAERWAETLSSAQRTAWNLYASSVNMLNKLGQTINLSGFNHYIRSNAFLSQYGITHIDAGPTTFTLPDQDPTLVITASEATQQVMVAFDDGLAWGSEDNAYLTTLFGQPQNPQRNFFGGPWKGIRYLSGSAGVPLVSPLPVGALFHITEGQRIWVQFRIYRADGRVSQPFEANCIVLAAFP
ncbi:hypothetical protein KAR91_84335 [Candidatus Pacearchaeota archaeon]|nr:hypothetical protein [Candidatus Pacearchaeota archaeon]